MEDTPKNNFLHKAKKPFLALAMATIFAGNVSAMEFKSSKNPNQKPTTVEQFMPKSATEFNGEYDAAEAMKLFQDMENSPLFQEICTTKFMSDEEVLAKGLDIKTEAIDYIRRSKVNNQKLRIAYQKFYAGKEMPKVISKVLNHEYVVEYEDGNYLSTKYSMDNYGVISDDIRELNYLASRPENIDMLLDTSKIEEKLEQRSGALDKKIGDLVKSCWNRAKYDKNKIIDNQKQLELLKEGVDGLSPSVWGDEQMREGFLLEICNGFLLEDILDYSFRRNIDIRKIIEAAAQPYEQPQVEVVKPSYQPAKVLASIDGVKYVLPHETTPQMVTPSNGFERYQTPDPMPSNEVKPAECSPIECGPEMGM